MADPQQLLSEFVAAYGRRGDTDPRPFLAQLEGVDREELRVLIEAFLERAPRREWDAKAFEGSMAERAVTAAASQVDAPSVEDARGWTELLPALRNRAQLRRADLVERLASALGFPDGEERVAAYYHRMEQGRLPSRGVSDRVLEALGQIVGAPADALRRAGEAGERGPEAGGEVFARVGEPTDPLTLPGTEDADWSEAVEGPPHPDELDRLFIGGD